MFSETSIDQMERQGRLKEQSSLDDCQAVPSNSTALPSFAAMREKSKLILSLEKQ